MEKNRASVLKRIAEIDSQLVRLREQIANQALQKEPGHLYLQQTGRIYDAGYAVGKPKDGLPKESESDTVRYYRLIGEKKQLEDQLNSM